MNQEVTVQVKFKIVRDGFSLVDAFAFTPEEYAGLSQEQLDAMKAERFNTWKEHILQPAPEIKITIEEEIESIDKELEEIEFIKSERQQKKQKLVEKKLKDKGGK